MPYKFEQLDVWKLSLEYIDSIYELAEKLPKSEEYNLKSQIVRAATSISLNIAEGSTGQSDAEQARFLGMAIRSLVETVACHHIIQRRGYIRDEPLLAKIYEDSQVLARKLQAFRKIISPYQVREEQLRYGEDDLP
ncbi:MAG: four helix bundle protein [Chloroflexota bacterium]|nr:four helix bundle protein [Chloroflexota bacterium]MBI5703097.1 four helix bundle protein [Chloroflexota bacterium]